MGYHFSILLVVVGSTILLLVIANVTKDWFIQRIQQAIASRRRTSVLDRLCVQFKHDDSAERLAAVAAVERLGKAASKPEVLTGLTDLLADEESAVRCSAASALGHLHGWHGATPSDDTPRRFLELLQDQNDQVQLAVLRGLWFVRKIASTREIISRLTELLNAEQPATRRSAATALGYLYRKGETAPLEILLHLARLFGDADDEVRMASVTTVRYLLSLATKSQYSPASRPDPCSDDTHELLDRLADLLTDRQPKVRCSAAIAIGYLLGPQGVAPPEIFVRLFILLQEGNDEVKYAVASASFKTASATPEVLARLANLMQDENCQVRQACLVAVHHLGAAAATPELLDRLADLLRDDDELLQIASSAVMHHMGETAATAATPAFLARLAALLWDRTDAVREAAAITVSRLGDVAANPELVLRLTELLHDRNPDVRYEAATAIIRHHKVAKASALLLARTIEPPFHTLGACASDRSKITQDTKRH